MRPSGVVSRNPIEGRLAQLYEQWESFATDPDARVLRWLIRDDERRMFEAFLAVEDDEEGELDVLFFSFDLAFEDRRYGHELRRELDRRLRAMDEDFAALGLPPWAGSGSELTVSDIGLLMQTCAALTRQLGELVEAVALVLWPKAVADPERFAAWLDRAARVVPPRVRLVVVDRAEAPLLTSHVEVGDRTRSVAANLDMAGALEELAAAAPEQQSPGGRFRAAFVAMSAALSRGELNEARAQGERAQALASESGFEQLEVAVPFALASGLQAGGDTKGAIEQFSAAEQRAARAQARANEWAAGLRVKAQLGLAGVLLGAEAWPRAGEAYAKAGALAGETGDRATQVEALRMGAWAYERGGEVEEAWALGLIGLEVAEGLDAEALAGSTVPWLGEGLLRLSAEGARFEAERLGVARRLGRLLGGGWRRG